VSPPAPEATSSTPTATWGRPLPAGAYAANQASVSVGSLAWSSGGQLSGFSGSGSHFLVVRSSAVPVLPATSTPGIAARTPVPPRTTASMSRSIVRATRGLVARSVAAWRPCAAA
jgi:hypothetical protein